MELEHRPSIGSALHLAYRFPLRHRDRRDISPDGVVDDSLEQRRFRPEHGLDRLLGDAGGLRDVPDARSRPAALLERLPGGRDDGPARLRGCRLACGRAIPALVGPPHI